jgi:hypothetical protein
MQDCPEFTPGDSKQQRSDTDEVLLQETGPMVEQPEATLGINTRLSSAVTPNLGRKETTEEPARPATIAVAKSMFTGR